MTSPPEDEYSEEYPPVDSGFRSIFLNDDDYDEEWGTWEAYNPHDAEMLPRRNEEIVPVSEDYL